MRIMQGAAGRQRLCCGRLQPSTAIHAWIQSRSKSASYRTSSLSLDPGSLPRPKSRPLNATSQGAPSAQINSQQQAPKKVNTGIGLQIIDVPDCTVEEHIHLTGARTATRKQWTKPYLLLLPDFDGVGVTSSKRWPSIATGMEMQALRIDATYQGSFSDLIQYITDHLITVLADVPPERPTFLLGEGFGGVVALAAMLNTKLQAVVNRVVLINPATAFKHTPLRRLAPLLHRLPPSVMQGAPLALVPLLGGSPVDLVSQVVASAGRQGPAAVLRPEELATNAMGALIGALEQLQQLSRHLPPATMMARMKLLDQGLQSLEGRLCDVETRTMILAGGRDFLPSAEEAKRLTQEMPRAFCKILPDAGHALLMEPGVDLLELMREEGFLIERRKFSSPVKPGTSVAFGVAGPIELPTKQEVARAGRELTAPLRRFCSPVFLSTMPDGTIVEGMAGIDIQHRPLLFVGNHQLYALDMNLLVEEIYLQTGMLLRGLAHPALFTSLTARATNEARSKITPAPARPNGATDTTTDTAAAKNGNGNRSTPSGRRPSPRNSSTAATVAGNGSTRNGAPMNNAVPMSTAAAGVSKPGRNGQGPAPPARLAAPIRLGDIYRTFGAVAAGEAVLLYPGGVREGFKRRDEKYELFWPEKGEFVRMAAKQNAWVVPISAIGWEDSINIVMDTDEIARHPLLGAAARAASDATPRARDAENEHDQTFIPPFIAPSVPARLYFLFGQPVPLDKALASDREAADTVYKNIKATVKDGITWLLQRREQDPYKDLVPRLVYENNPVGARKQAPFFKLPAHENPTTTTNPPQQATPLVYTVAAPPVQQPPASVTAVVEEQPQAEVVHQPETQHQPAP